MLEIKGELSTKQIIRLTVPLFLEQIVLLGLPVINAILVSSAGQAASTFTAGGAANGCSISLSRTNSE